MSKQDFTPATRKRVYDTIVAVSAIIAPVAGIWGLSIDEPTVAAVVLIIGSILGAGGNTLARRNITPDNQGG